MKHAAMKVACPSVLALWKWILCSLVTCADAHVTAVVACAWLDGPPITALTADSRGRVVQYNVSAYLSIMGAAPIYPFRRQLTCCVSTH